MDPITLGQTFIVCRAQLEDDSTVSYVLSRSDGRELYATDSGP